MARSVVRFLLLRNAFAPHDLGLVLVVGHVQKFGEENDSILNLGYSSPILLYWFGEKSSWFKSFFAKHSDFLEFGETRLLFKNKDIRYNESLHWSTRF